MKIDKFNESNKLSPKPPKLVDTVLGETKMIIETEIIFRVSVSKTYGKITGLYSLRLKIPGLKLGNYDWYVVGTGLTKEELEIKKQKILSEMSNFHKDVNKYNV